MKIVKDGNSSIIYSDDLQVFTSLQPAIYNVMFHSQRGFWLQEEENELKNLETKIYGKHNERINKIFNTYNKINRNLGVLLSGEAGLGKSLMIQLICLKALKNQMPIIMINEPYDGITKYLATITQPCVFVFDEFEKKFAKDKNGIENPAETQDNLLTFFDGVFSNKHLFVVGVNQLSKVNPYFLNRPGRFHYHFKLTFPTGQEIKEYLSDKLLPQYIDCINEVVKFAILNPLSYDALRAIVLDINNGYPITETIKDLNISSYNTTNSFTFIITIYYSTGEKYTATMSSDILFDRLTNNRPSYIPLISFCDKDNAMIHVNFDFTNLRVEEENFKMVVPLGDVKFLEKGKEYYDDDLTDYKLPSRYSDIQATAKIEREQKNNLLDNILHM